MVFALKELTEKLGEINYRLTTRGVCKPICEEGRTNSCGCREEQGKFLEGMIMKWKLNEFKFSWHLVGLHLISEKLR